MKDHFKEMYDELTNPVKLEEARRKYAVKKYVDDKKTDSGIC